MIILLAGFSLIRPRLLNGHWHFLDWLERNSKSQWLVVIVCGRCFSSSTVRAALLRVWESDQKPPGGSLNMFEMLAKEILSFFLSLCSSICVAFHPCGPSGGQLDKHSRFWHCCSFVLGFIFLACVCACCWFWCFSVYARHNNTRRWRVFYGSEVVPLFWLWI